MQMATGGDINEWELSKENVQPLKHGRKLCDLTSALKPSAIDPERCHRLKEKKQEFEIELRTYDGNDPFDVWDRYIKWTEQNYPTGSGQLLPLLQKCVTVFSTSANSTQYRNDTRYIHAWIKFANLVPTPMDVFTYLHDNNIGTEVASLYDAWASELERQGNLKRANQIYLAGLEANAGPRQWLQSRYREFEARVARAVITRTDSDTVADTDDEQRSVLGPLKQTKSGKVGTLRVGAAKLQQATTPAFKSAAPTQIQKATKFEVYTESCQPSYNLPAPTKQHPVPDYSRINRENEQTPGVWTNARAKQQQSAAVKEVVSSSKPAFTIHEDTNQPSATPRKLPIVGNVLSSRKPEKPRSAVEGIESAAASSGDLTQRVMYRKDVVYCGNMEFEFQELRACHWMLKHRKMLMQILPPPVRPEAAQRCTENNVVTGDPPETRASDPWIPRVSVAPPLNGSSHPQQHASDTLTSPDHDQVEHTAPRYEDTFSHGSASSSSRQQAVAGTSTSGGCGQSSFLTPNSSVCGMNNTGSGGGTTGSVRSLDTPASDNLGMTAPSPHTKQAYQVMMGIFNKTLDINRSTVTPDSTVNEGPSLTAGFNIHQGSEAPGVTGVNGPLASTLPFTIHCDHMEDQKQSLPRQPNVIQGKGSMEHSVAAGNHPSGLTLYQDRAPVLPAGSSLSEGLPFTIHCDEISSPLPQTVSKNTGPTTHQNPAQPIQLGTSTTFQNLEAVEPSSALPFTIHCDDESSLPSSRIVKDKASGKHSFTTGNLLIGSTVNQDGYVVATTTSNSIVSGANLPFTIHCDTKNLTSNLSSNKGYNQQDEPIGHDEVEHYPSGIYYMPLNDVNSTEQNDMFSRRSLGLPLAGTINQNQASDTQPFCDDVTIAVPGSLNDFVRHAQVVSTPFLRSKPDSKMDVAPTDLIRDVLHDFTTKETTQKSLSESSSVTDGTQSRNLALSSVQQDNPYNLSPILEGSDEDRLLSTTAGCSHVLPSHCATNGITNSTTNTNSTNNTNSTTNSSSNANSTGNSVFSELCTNSVPLRPVAGKRPRESIGEHVRNVMGCLTDLNMSDSDDADDVDDYRIPQWSGKQGHADRKTGDGDGRLPVTVKMVDAREDRRLDSIKSFDPDVGSNKLNESVSLYDYTERGNEGYGSGDRKHGVNVAFEPEVGDVEMKPDNRNESRGLDIPEKISRAVDVDLKDPFSNETIAWFLKDLMPSIRTWRSYHEVHSKFPMVKQNSRLSLDGTQYSIHKLIATGGYATVHRAERHDPKAASRPCALKIQSPAFLWEFYIMNELHSRVVADTKQHDRDATPSLVTVNEGYFYEDKSCLELELYPLGTLLSFINKYRHDNKMRASLEPFATYIAIELLCIAEQLHACDIIHGDVKPDNFVLLTSEPTVERSIDPDIVFGTTTRMLKLIDFGQAIDMTLYPPDTTFTCKVETQGFQCVEMMHDKPWTYQTDLFGFLATIHVVIFGQYMNIYNCQGKMRPCSSIPRGWNTELWKRLFHDLLNIPDCRHLPNIAELRRAFEQHFIRSDFIASFSSLMERLNAY